MSINAKLLLTRPFIYINAMLFGIIIGLCVSFKPSVIVSIIVVIYAGILSKRKPIIIFIILIILNENLFYLVNVESLNLGNSFNTTNLLFVFSIIVFLVYTNFYKENFQTLLFRKEIILFISLLVVLTLRNNLAFGQTVFDGVVADRKYYLYMLYFPLVFIFNSEKNRASFLKYISILGTVVAAIGLYEFFTNGNSHLFDPNFVMLRNNSIRLIYWEPFSIFCFFASFTQVIKRDLKINPYYLHLIVQILFIVFVMQTRMIIFGLLIATSYILFSQKKFKLKVFYFFTLVTSTLFIFSTKNSILNLISLSRSEVNMQTGSYGIRINEALFYWNMIKRYWLIGVGNINSKYSSIVDMMYGRSLNYYENDVGLLGFIFTFGAIGLLIITAILLKAFANIDQLKGSAKEWVVFKGFFIYSLIVILTICIYQQGRYTIYICAVLAFINSLKNQYQNPLQINNSELKC